MNREYILLTVNALCASKIYSTKFAKCILRGLVKILLTLYPAPFPMKLRILTHLKNPAFHLLVAACIGLGAQSQDITRADQLKSSDIPDIMWVKQWPEPGKNQRSHSFKERFNTIFLGKKTPVLSKPVSVSATDTGNFWALDQSAMSAFHIKDEVGDMPHYFQKAGYDFTSLVAICAAPDGSLYFSDSQANKIYRILPDKKKVQPFGDSLVQPTGIAFSSLTNEIWVVETGAHRISVLNSKGQIVKQIGARGTSPGEFNYPTHIWVDNSGLVYVVDAMNFRIQVMNPSGAVVSVFGKPGDASGYLSRPKGIATDSHGNIYIADALFHVVQVFDLTGKYLYNLGAQGQGKGEFWMPSGIFIDKKDYLYVADTYNSRIQIFQLVYALK